MKPKLKDVIQTILTILDDRWKPESAVKIRIDSRENIFKSASGYEVTINSDGIIIETKYFGLTHLRNRR